MMIRRQAILSILSLIAASTVSAATSSPPFFGKTSFPLGRGGDDLPSTGDEEFNLGTVIKVIGVGGAGCNMVSHVMAGRPRGIEFILANTDSKALNRTDAFKAVQLGSSGLSAGSDPAVGAAAAQAAEGDIRAAIDGAHMLFVAAGMGGGTGTGAAPVIARIARDMGILTVGLVTKPFEWEGERRMSNAEAGLAELEASVDSLIVVLNEKLLEVLGEGITLDQAFAHANDVMKNAVGGITEIINVRGLVNVDFEDVRIIMSEPGRAIVGSAIAAGPDRARIAAEQAMSSPLVGDIDLSDANAVLVLVSAGKRSLQLSESRLAMNTIRGHGSVDAHFIYGTAHDECLGEQIRVTVIATGFKAGA